MKLSEYFAFIEEEMRAFATARDWPNLAEVQKIILPKLMKRTGGRCNPAIAREDVARVYRESWG